jgi:dipeptidyl aminopeptidase/acylaminoacyl peptidase
MTTSTEPIWVQRYTATSLGFPSWNDTRPDRLAVVSNRGGRSQVWAHDLTDGSWRQVSNEPIGVEVAWVLPDGRIAWWRDATGAERGHLVAVPFEGGDPVSVFPSIADGWLMGLSFAAGRAALGVEIDGSYRIYLIEPDGTTRELAAFDRAAGVGGAWGTTNGGLSPDGRLLCISHAEHGDLLHSALRVLDVETGATTADLEDPGRHLEAAVWVGDDRLAFTSQLGAFERPGLWAPRTGTRYDVGVDLPGAVFPVDRFADGALLARHEFEGAAQLVRLREDGSFDALTDLTGDIEAARVRPDGAVWYLHSDASTPPATKTTAGEVAVMSPDPSPPPGRPYESRFTTNPHGDRIQMLVVTPDGVGPFRTVLNIHGGPEWHERDRYDAEVQAFVDHGYAVASINYRGSTGYGVAFREALIRRVCLTESEDILACLDALVADGTTDPAHVYWSGWSWGGCLACFHAGAHPDRFRAIFAGIPAGDFVAAHWASAPELQAWDQAAHGGNPDEAPESFRQSNPMTYVDAVRSPTLIIAGEHDPRCPIEGITPWVDAVRAHGGEVDVHTYGAGHHANGMDEQVRHMQWVLDFFAAHA